MAPARPSRISELYFRAARPNRAGGRGGPAVHVVVVGDAVLEGAVDGPGASESHIRVILPGRASESRRGAGSHVVVVGDAVLEGAGDGPGVHELGELLQLLREAQLRLCRVG